MSEARGAVIEIVDRRKGSVTDSPGGSVLVPNEVRINGKSVLCPADRPVIVHEISGQHDELVAVTLTVFASRVEIKAEVGDE